jgi:hypothetical protein
MNHVLQNSYDAFMRQLQEFRSDEPDILLQSKKSVDAGMQAMKELREYIIAKPFKTQEEEIFFFKETKPLFQCQLVYWLKVLNYELSKPTGTCTDIEAYILTELHSLKLFFDNNIDFYRYWRSGQKHMDEQYFSRGKNVLQIDIDIELLDTDPQFSSSHDSKLSRLFAHEMLADFLNSELETLSGNNQVRTAPGSDDLFINWTASKSGLIELMYACKSCGAFNHGKASINQIADLFERIFNIKLGNYYRTFQEIRIRKKGRTIFLDQMREKLIARMDDSDENPR